VSVIHCKKIYSATKTPKEIEVLSKREDGRSKSLAELRLIEDITICEGFVIEAEWTLNVKKPTVELVCLHCGKRFYYETRKYLTVLDALGIDYSGRLP
jgi:hypothetical protein